MCVASYLLLLPEGAGTSSAFFRLLFRSVGVVGAAAADPPPKAEALMLEGLRWPPLLPLPLSGVRSSLVSRISRSDEPVLKFESWLCCW